MYNNNKAKILLANGICLEGYSLGLIGTTIGEVCFNTGMTGYQEILTDPSYCGQLITMTFPQIGNYGVNKEDSESKKIHASGLIVRESLNKFSNFRANETLSNYLIKNNVVGIQGIDTRYLTKIIREQGSMNAIITSENISDKKMYSLLSEHPSMEGLNLSKVVSCKSKYTLNKNNKFKVAVIDYGIKHNILRQLESNNCSLTVFPFNVTSNEIKEFNPDGIFLSNGPGDPAAVKGGIQAVSELLSLNIPIFGICLGHQILCLALGAKTYKLKFGHRGCNHPVQNLQTGVIEITSQNHGFAVQNLKIPKNIDITHLSLNDNTIEGIECNNKPVFSVQYHPESSPGPHDSRYLFRKFNKMMTTYKKHSAYAKAQ